MRTPVLPASPTPDQEFPVAGLNDRLTAVKDRIQSLLVRL